MPRASAFSDEYLYEASDPDGFRSGRLQVGAAADGHALAVKLFELPPGESVCPYHYEYEEEWLVVLDGEVAVRTPTGRETLSSGEVMSFPAGPEGAHKVSNASQTPARVMMFSSAREPAVAVYPDSDKIGVYPGNPDDEVILHRVDGSVEYFDGER